MADPPCVAAASVLFRPDTAQLAALLRALDRDRRRLFLFVNGALSAAVESDLAALTNARVLRSDGNLGLGVGLNAVMDAAAAEGFGHVLLFDQDSEPEPGMAAALAERFAALEQAGVRVAAVGPLLVTPPAGNYRKLRYSWRDRAIGRVDFVPTSGSLVSLAAWRAVGPFRADYFVDGIDVEWGLRAWRHGYACVVARDIRMVHRWGLTATDRRRATPQILRQPDARTFFYLRNAVDTLRRPHAPRSWRWRRAATLLVQVAALLVTRRCAASTRTLVWRALRDGWRGALGALPADLAADQ